MEIKKLHYDFSGRTITVEIGKKLDGTAITKIEAGEPRGGLVEVTLYKGSPKFPFKTIYSNQVSFYY